MAKEDEYEAPTPTQEELNAINRRVHGLPEAPEGKDETDAKAKADADAKAKADAEAKAKATKAVEGDKPGTYHTR